MRRGAGTRRWIAASGGVLINGLILGALVLVEQAPPQLEEPPVMVVDLERPEKQKASKPRGIASAGGVSAPSRASEAPTAPSGQMTSTAPAEPTPPVIDPAWRVDPQAVDRWKLTEGVPAWGWGRYHRACSGLSSEHMTPEEKERCYAGWNDRKDRRPSPNFIGPVDETQWEEPEPGPPRRSTSEDDKRRRRDLCRVVDRMRKADPSMKPGLRQGACP